MSKHGVDQSMVILFDGFNFESFSFARFASGNDYGDLGQTRMGI